MPDGPGGPSLRLPSQAVLRARGYVCDDGSSEWFVETGLSTAPVLAPTIRTDPSDFGVESGQFGFGLSGIPGQIVVIEASWDLEHWTALATNALPATPLLFRASGTFRCPRSHPQRHCEWQINLQ